MNKFSLFLLACSTAFIFAGCSSAEKASEISSVSSVSSQEESSLSEDSAEPTQPELPERELEPAEGTYIYDNAGVFDADAFSECNNYAEWLYENYLINSAVVTTNDLGDLTPEEYAKNAYMDIYGGKGSGLLLLINNDTNKDFLYKTGSCSGAIDENTEAQTFFWATKELVAGDYKTAALRLMQLGELCSEYVFDNGGVFTSEQISALEGVCSSSPEGFTVLATGNSTGSSNEEICRTYYERHYKERSGSMIMVDTVSKSVLVMKDGAVVSAAENSALEKANQLAGTGDFYGAVNELLAV